MKNLTRFLLFGLLTLLAFSPALRSADDDDKKKEEEALREQVLKSMKKQAAAYTVTFDNEQKTRLKFHEEPLLRFSNPIGGAIDGSIFLWSHRGRPQAFLKLYTYNNKNFNHEWLSLTESSMIADRTGKTIWEPSEPGLKLKELPDAPKPADSAAERLRQMKTLAGKFTSTFSPKYLEEKSYKLRLMTQPIFRVEMGDEAQLDGAIFAFVQSTAPIAFLFFEVSKTPEGPRYHYTFVSGVIGPVTARYGEKEIFSLEKNYWLRDPKLPYLQLSNQPIPKD